MATQNTKLSISVPPDAHKQLKAFQDKHKIKSLSSAIVTLMESYLELAQREASAQAREPETDSSLAFALTKRIDELAARLALVEEELSKPSSDHRIKPNSSLQLTPTPRQPDDAIYGGGEAADLFYGWEVPANVSYVFSRFQELDNDEAKAAFADKWVSMCIHSIETALVVCYPLLRIIKEKEVYKTSHWVEGNKIYDSFKDYFKHRCHRFFQKWLELELTHQFVTENCRPFLEALLPLENSLKGTNNCNSETVLATKSTKKQSKVQTDTPQLDEAIEELATDTKSASKTLKEQPKTQETALAVERPQELTREKVKLMTTAEVVQFCGLTTGQLNRGKQQGNLPIEVLIDGVKYSIDYVKKGVQGRNLWSVKLLQKKENRQKQKKASQPTQKKTDSASTESQTSTNDSATSFVLTQTSLSERLKVPRSTFRRKKNQMSKSEFAQWTGSKDPDGIAWVYSVKLKQYHPVS
ncbi:hypothetical protein [Lyngbya aestuarii]|uniref:hypothetical protein n=1 Tax=Lyngbya aestuarii TaxID=118322 RepID=UPI00403E2F5A